MNYDSENMNESLKLDKKEVSVSYEESEQKTKLFLQVYHAESSLMRFNNIIHFAMEFIILLIILTLVFIDEKIIKIKSLSNIDSIYKIIYLSLSYITITLDNSHEISESIFCAFDCNNNCSFDIGILYNTFGITCDNIKLQAIISLLVDSLYCLTLLISIFNAIIVILYYYNMINFVYLERLTIMKIVQSMFLFSNCIIYLVGSRALWISNINYYWEIIMLPLPFVISVISIMIYKKSLRMIIRMKSLV